MDKPFRLKEPDSEPEPLPTTHGAWLQLCRSLFEMIDREDDPTALIDIGDVLDTLIPVLDQRVGGLLHDLWLWAGLKLDEPTMAENYRLRLDEATQGH